jgi:invasion protein IalB
MHQLIRPILVALAVLLPGIAALARSPEPTFVANYRDWALFTYRDGNGLVCYIASEPVKKDGNYTRRGPAAALVARFPMDPPNVQVSVQSGYPYKEKSEVEVKIGDATYTLFTSGENAFARNAAEDERLIAAMKRGTQMTVRGTSQKGTWSLDTYSLQGFSAAYQAMLDACKQK